MTSTSLSPFCTHNLYDDRFLIHFREQIFFFYFLYTRHETRHPKSRLRSNFHLPGFLVLQILSDVGWSSKIVKNLGHEVKERDVFIFLSFVRKKKDATKSLDDAKSSKFKWKRDSRASKPYFHVKRGCFFLFLLSSRLSGLPWQKVERRTFL